VRDLLIEEGASSSSSSSGSVSSIVAGLTERQITSTGAGASLLRMDLSTFALNKSLLVTIAFEPKEAAAGDNGTRTAQFILLGPTSLGQENLIEFAMSPATNRGIPGCRTVPASLFKLDGCSPLLIVDLSSGSFGAGELDPDVVDLLVLSAKYCKGLRPVPVVVRDLDNTTVCTGMRLTAPAAQKTVKVSHIILYFIFVRYDVVVVCMKQNWTKGEGAGVAIVVTSTFNKRFPMLYDDPNCSQQHKSIDEWRQYYSSEAKPTIVFDVASVVVIDMRQSASDERVLEVKVKVKVYQFQKAEAANRNTQNKFLCFAVCPPVVLVLGRPVKQWSSCGIGGHAVCRLLCVLEERKKTSEIYTGKGKKSLRPEEQAAVGQLRLFCVVGNDGEYTAEDGQFIRCICGAKSKLNKPWNHNNFLAHYDKCAFVQTANKLSANGTGVPGSKQDGSKIAAFFTKAAKVPSPPPKLESHKSQRRPHRKLNLHFGGKQRRCRLDLKKNHCEQKYPLCLFRFSASVRNTA